MSDLALIVVLVAAPIAYVLQWLWLRDRYAKQRADAQITAAATQRERDAYGDALKHVLDLADWSDMDAVRAAAKTALAMGSYPGDLATAKALVEQFADENAALRAAGGQ